MRGLCAGFLVFVTLLAPLGATLPSCEDRLRALEPPAPTTIPDGSFGDAPPSVLYPAETVLAQGHGVPYRSAYNDPGYHRPAYVPEWHSDDLRWAYAPRRVHTALHRIFGVYPTASMYYDFIGELGLTAESAAFDVDFSKPLESIVLAVMQFEPEGAAMLGNQVVLTGKPSGKGLQILQFNLADIVPENPEESVLFQLSTDGAVLDETAMPYA